MGNDLLRIEATMQRCEHEEKEMGEFLLKQCLGSGDLQEVFEQPVEYKGEFLVLLQY